jgi:FkbM family methyltransferase
MAAETCSYQGQDRFVLDVLGGMRSGFFIDSGASDGTNGSNTRLLEQRYGWRGICIEPNAHMFRALLRERRGPCFNCCLSDRDGPVEFLELAGVYGGILDAYDRRQLDAVRGLIGLPKDAEPPTVTKPARTIASILDEVHAPRLIDYWSLDTEGSELAILRSFPFDRYRFRVLTVEHNAGPLRAIIRAFLEANGYVLVRTLGIDDGYVWSGEPTSSVQSPDWQRGDRHRRDWRSRVWRRARLRWSESMRS